MIISVGHRINQVFGSEGSCYRMSGDEFVCVFEGYPEEKLNQKGLELIQLLKEDNMKTPYPISVSMGIAKFDPVLDGSFDDLLNRSDQLMYEDKKRQKNKNLTR